MNKKQRIILIVAVVIFVIMIAIGLGGSVLQSQMGKLVVTSIPDDSTVTLDGKPIKSNGTTYTQPGKHTIKATRNQFKDQTQNFSIVSGETKAFNFYMLSDGDAGHQWLKDHPDQASAIEGYYGTQIFNKATALYENNVILQQLPVIDNTYRIDYGV